MDKAGIMSSSIFCASKSKENYVMWPRNKACHELNIQVCSQLHSFMKGLVKNSLPKHIIIDLQGIDRIDSSVIGVWININQYMRELGLGKIVLTNIQDSVVNILEMLDIRYFFNEFPSVDEALTKTASY